MMAVRMWGSTFAWELVGPFLNDRLTACEGGRSSAVGQRARGEGRDVKKTGCGTEKKKRGPGNPFNKGKREDEQTTI